MQVRHLSIEDDAEILYFPLVIQEVHLKMKAQLNEILAPSFD